MKQNWLFAFSIALFAVFAVAVIILSAIDRGTLPVLMFAVIAVCIVSAALAAFSIRQYERWTNARIKAIELQNSFVLSMAREGYLPKNSGYESVKQIAAPDEDIPVSTQGVTGTMLIEYRQDALEIVALSKQIMPRQGNGDQVIPYYKAKTAHEYFRSGIGFERWQHGIQYLLANQRITERTQKGQKGTRHLGYFCLAGTVGQLYDWMQHT